MSKIFIDSDFDCNEIIIVAICEASGPFPVSSGQDHILGSQAGVDGTWEYRS